MFAKASVFATIAAVLAASPALALSPDETDAKKIMNAAEDRDRGDRMPAQMTLTIRDDSGSERNRVLRQRSIEFEGGTRTLILFADPTDVRGTGLLTVDYDDGAKDDDQWLYLPSLKKTSRITSSGKSGSFMGSDFSYSDMTQADPDQYNYKIVKQSDKAGGEDCWVIHAKAKTKKEADETGYVDQKIWVSKSKLMPLQIKARVKKGKKIKYLKFGDVKKVDGVWVAHHLSARLVRNKKMESESVFVFKQLKLNDPAVTEDNFSQRALEAGI